MGIWGSYSAEFRNVIHNASWIYYRNIAERLGCELTNYSIGGSSLSYTYCKFHEVSKSFQEGDHIIITLSSLDRKYFFYDRPELSMYQCFESTMMFNVNGGCVSYSHNEKSAFKDYMKYLDKNPLLDTVNLVNFLYAVDRLALKLKLKVVIMCGFADTRDIINDITLDNVIVANNQLINVSVNECESYSVFDRMLDMEYRSCHISRSNHEVLSDKILNAFATGESFDVTDDIHLKLITDEIVDDGENNREFMQAYIQGYCDPEDFK